MNETTVSSGLAQQDLFLYCLLVFSTLYQCYSQFSVFSVLFLSGPVGLESFFRKIREVQTSFTPYKSYLTKEQFKPYNPEPQAVKKLTDQTKRLYEELLEIKASLEVGKLKLHERRQLAVAEHELKHFFGKPYGNNYYTG